MNKYKNICVFCASSSKVSIQYIDAAFELGCLIADANGNCICGAGDTGLMAAVSNGALSRGGTVTGIIPQFMVDNGWNHMLLTEMIVTPNMHTRKQAMAERADAVIALPGGCGTFEELMEAITWKQLGIFTKPIIILNIAGYYNPLIEMLNQAIKEGFMKQSHATLWIVATTPLEAMSILDNMNDCPINEIESKY